MLYISKQQENIVQSDSPFKLINGCAGSHKTDTLIKCAIQSLNTCKDSIQFLTLVSSVTYEIKTRLEASLKIELKQSGKSNHYVGYYNEIPIVISNFDSWVHLMLSLNQIEIDDIIDCYQEKVDLLCSQLSTSESFTCQMKTGHKMDKVFLDEAQDLTFDKMNILVLLGKKTDSKITIAGDYLQTLFTSRRCSWETHSMNVFKSLSPQYFDLNICMRCPKAHIDFNNIILKKAQKKYSIPPMEFNNANNIDKPFIFTHLKNSSTTGFDNTNARINAEKVTIMIETLMDHDPTVVPGDIVILMAKSKQNELFFQLQYTMNLLFKKRGFDNHVVHMTTEGDGYHNALNWNTSEGKSVLISIHGDKGKGHKVVFFLGFTENSIPREIYLHKSSEIISESLLNVAITRSTKYLFIGFTYNYPSRYLVKTKEHLDKIAYLAWKKEPELPEPYHSIRKNIHFCQGMEPRWPDHGDDITHVGTKSMLTIKDDISRDFEQPKYLSDFKWKQVSETTIFGEPQQFQMPLQEDHMLSLGVMAELLIRRQLCKPELTILLKQNFETKTVMFTEDERFLSFMYDINNHECDKSVFDEYLLKYHAYFSKNRDLEKLIKEAFQQRKKVLHCMFSNDKFQADLELFFSDSINSELPTSCIWNVALLYNQLTQKFYRPGAHCFLNFFNEDLSTLHKNIELFITNYLCESSADRLLFEYRLGFHATFSHTELLKLGKKNHIVSIKGRCDIVNKTNNHLFEIKASSLDHCSNQWISQTLMYSLCLDAYGMKMQKMSIVNLLKGCIWTWNELPCQTLEDTVTNKISTFYEWHDLETAKIVKEIDKKRKQ